MANITEQEQTSEQFSPDSIKIGRPVNFYEVIFQIDPTREADLDTAIIRAGDRFQDIDELENCRLSGFRMRIDDGNGGEILQQSFTRSPMHTYGISSDDEMKKKAEILREELDIAGIAYTMFDSLPNPQSPEGDLSHSFSEEEDFRYLLGVPPQQEDGDYYSGKLEDKAYFASQVALIKANLGDGYTYQEVEIFSYGGRNIAGSAEPYRERVLRIGGKLTNKADLVKHFKLIDDMRQHRVYMEMKEPSVSFDIETRYCPEERSDIEKTKRISDTHIWFMRHGKVEDQGIIYERADGIDLSEEGLEESAFIGDYFNGIGSNKGFVEFPGTILASPRERTVETAQQALKYYGLQLFTPDTRRETRLDEIAAPALRGRSTDYFVKLQELGIPTIFDVPDDFDPAEFPKPDETREQVVERTQAVIDELPKGQAAWIITHGNIIEEYVTKIIGKRLIQYPPTGSITHLVFDSLRQLISYEVIPQEEVKDIVERVRSRR